MSLTTGSGDDYALIADLYDHVPLYRDRADVAFFVEHAAATAGPVLEIGCGTGRVLIPIARAGIDVVGLDVSPAMLAACREHLLDEGDGVRRHVELVAGDMRGFDLARRFPLVVVPFRAFQHLLTVDDQLACLAAIRRHLSPDGRLIVDLFNPSLDALARPAGDAFGEEPEFTMPDGRRVVRRHRIVVHDRANQVLVAEILHDVTRPDGTAERVVQRFGMRYIFRFEMEHLLARAGFIVERLYGGYDRSEFGSTYPGELVFVARASLPRSSDMR